jgi:transposase
MARKRYTSEFRQTAVRLATQPGVSVERVAGELGIACWTLRRWLAAHGVERVRAAAPGGAAEDLHQRVRRLEAELRQVRMERDILKKATAFFAKEQP